MVINITVIIIFTGIKSNVEWAIRIKENKMLKAPALAGFPVNIFVISKIGG